MFQGDPATGDGHLTASNLPQDAVLGHCPAHEDVEQLLIQLRNQQVTVRALGAFDIDFLSVPRQVEVGDVTGRRRPFGVDVKVLGHCHLSRHRFYVVREAVRREITPSLPTVID